MAYFKCSGINPTGNAAVGDVLSGKTFSNDSGIDKTGTMPNNGAVSATLNTSTTSYTVPAGYHNGSGTVSISTQSKSASSSTSAQTITPDSGKVLSSVSISAISPQRSAGTAATTSGIDTHGPYVYFPYGWWPNANANYGCYTYLTAAQAVACCPKQEKTVTSSRSAQTVTPDSGKLLSKVTVNALAPTGTYTASSRGASLDMGATSNYRYVNTNSVPNTNSGTYTYASSSTGGTVDLGAANTYRYVNAANVYAKGKADVSAAFNSSYVNYYTTCSFSGWVGWTGTGSDFSIDSGYNASITIPQGVSTIILNISGDYEEQGSGSTVWRLGRLFKTPYSSNINVTILEEILPMRNIPKNRRATGVYRVKNSTGSQYISVELIFTGIQGQADISVRCMALFISQ